MEIICVPVMGVILGRKGALVATTYRKAQRGQTPYKVDRWHVKNLENSLEVGGANPVTVGHFGGGRCPAVAYLRLI